jgi:ubiquinone/menaquinone biosynthesis C-methylase UbiE
MNQEHIKKMVRDGYGTIAQKGGSCCQPSSSCCSPSAQIQTYSKALGYTDQQLGSVPEGANLGLGCGNPIALAALKEGDFVLDLGSGAGFDAFLAAQIVGPNGKVIGVDMTPEMVARARDNAQKAGYPQVEFRLGEIEHLPVGDGSMDIIISNCVINLVPDKEKVFQDAFRVLKPGGRIMISDIVLLRDLPAQIQDSVAAYIGCIAGATRKEKYLETMESAGFREISVLEETNFPVEWLANDPMIQKMLQDLKLSSEKIREFQHAVVSIKVKALKPTNG